MDIDEARCFLCMMPVSPGQLYLVVYMADPDRPSIAATQNRSGVIHLNHLQNVFNPSMIAVKVEDQPMYGPGHQRVSVQVAL